MNDPDRIDPLALIGKFAEQEKRLAEEIFLAPVVAGGKVRVRVLGVVYEMTVDDHRFQGWGLFRMSGPGHAQLVETASVSLIANYLKLFPRKRFVLIDQFDGHWFAMPASTSDSRFAIDRPVPIRLVSLPAASSFDTINARFDGACFWFEAIERRRDPAVARTLRQELEKKTDPDVVRCKGMTPQERLVYKMLYLRRFGASLPVDDRTRIAQALRHADATLDAFWYDGGVATVRFVADGQVHTVQINPTDMTAYSAGVCLSGQERDFDLTSLVGVLREARAHWPEYY